MTLFVPDDYKQRQVQIHNRQRNCWGYCPPEEKQHPLCDRHFVEICQEIAACERDRAIAFVEISDPALAQRMRERLP